MPLSFYVCRRVYTARTHEVIKVKIECKGSLFAIPLQGQEVKNQRHVVQSSLYTKLMGHTISSVATYLPLKMPRGDNLESE